MTNTTYIEWQNKIFNRIKTMIVILNGDGMNTRLGEKCKILFVITLLLTILFCGCISQSNKEDSDDGSTIGSLFSYTITGIDPGSGIMKNTETALDEYQLKEEGWILQTGSSDSMTDALLENVSLNQPIIITIWSPHAVFGVTNLRKLDDPKQIYNNPNQTRSFLEEYAPEWKDIDVASDVIASIVSTDFSENAAAAFSFLHKFNVSDTIQSDWIYEYSIEKKDPEIIAQQWIENNRELVDSWIPNKSVSLGKSSLVLGQPPWPGVTVKNQIASLILQEIGYNTSIITESAGDVYNDLINGQMDIMLAGWLPATHGDYWEGNTDKLTIAGINVYQTWLGLAIPDYVDESISSIEDLGE
jgi:glycine betaine/proline transport system substrate-binding protein